jgi:TonB family protein
VSVRICRRSGQLAGRHCAEHGGPVVERSFGSGEQPERRCDACKPPPPPDPEHTNRSAEARDAVLKREAEPEYPDHLREAGVEGTVVVSYTVDERGRVTDVSVSRSSGSKELDTCAVRAIKRFKYEPAIQAGQPRAVHRTRSFTFRIEG